MGDVGYKLPLELLVLPLLRHIVEHCQHAPLLLPVKGGHQQLQAPVPYLPLRLQVVGSGHDLLQRGQSAE